MSSHANTIRPEDLAEHMGWVLGLARSLVADPAAADDIAQDTWHAALRHPPHRHQPLRPWLARVTRNVASKWYRSRSRRTHHETASNDERDPFPSPDELVEASETFQVLATVLNEIADPFRSTLLLRYVKGMSAAQIAAGEGIPAGTVRWRIKRGLELMRERLDERHGGDRAAWRAGLLLLLPETKAAGLATSGTALAISLKLVAALLAIAFGLFAWKVIDRASTVSPVPPVAADARAATASDMTAAIELASTSVEPLSVRRATVKIAKPKPLPGHVQPDPAQAFVHARFIGDDGVALQRVSFEWPGGTDIYAQSDAKGRATLRFRPPSDRARVHVIGMRGGYATASIAADVAAGMWTDLGDVRLVRSATLSGVVVDAESRPVAGALVLVGPPMGEDEARGLTRTGPPAWSGFAIEPARTSSSGAFRVTGVPARALRVWAGSPAHAFAFTPELQVTVGAHDEKLTLTLAELSEDERIEGQIQDPSGRPVAGALVRWKPRADERTLFGTILPADQSWRNGSTFVRSSASGEFVLRPRLLSPHVLSVEDVEDRWVDVELEGVGPGERGVVLSFTEERRQ